jgi:hypothetical protein
MMKDTCLTPLTLGVEGGTKDLQVASARRVVGFSCVCSLDCKIQLTVIWRLTSRYFSSINNIGKKVIKFLFVS